MISNTHMAIHHHLKSSSYAILTGMAIKIDDVCLLPDIIVTDNEQDIEENKTYMESPKLVVEVLSTSTEKKDRGEKFLHYINCPSIQEYVLISQDSMLVQVYTRKDLEWGYRGYTRGEKVELKSIGLIFPIEELYERVILPPFKS